MMDEKAGRHTTTDGTETTSRSAARSDGLAAVAIIILTIALIAFVVSQLV